jgi:DNA-binding transcriptional LysR family regulator
MFQQVPGAIDGRLRLDLPIGFARKAVIPRLHEFLARHPRVAIDLSTTDRRVDVVEEGFDCVLRVGALADSGLVARTLGRLRMVNCASPGYLATHGTPTSLGDLDRHLLVRYSQALLANAPGWEYPDGRTWKFRDMPSVVTVNNSDTYMDVCLAGLGLIQVPLIGAAPHLADGTLVEVLPAWTAEPMPVSLVYANRRNLPKRVQALMDWLAEVLAPSLEATR